MYLTPFDRELRPETVNWSLRQFAIGGMLFFDQRNLELPGLDQAGAMAESVPHHGPANAWATVVSPQIFCRPQIGWIQHSP